MHFCGLLLTRIFPSPPAVNGYLYGNLPGLTMCKNDKVSWHLIGLGSHYDMHGVHFQGNTIDLRGMTRDGLALFPHLSGTALMQPDRVGTFMNWFWLCGTCRYQSAKITESEMLYSAQGGWEHGETPWGPSTAENSGWITFLGRCINQICRCTKDQRL